MNVRRVVVLWFALLLCTLVLLGIAMLRSSGRVFVIDQPARSDVILVLDGDNNDIRLQRAVNLSAIAGQLHKTWSRRA